jgi:hypothetical protein
MHLKKFIRYTETSRIWFDKRIKFDVNNKFEGSHDYIDLDDPDVEDYILDFPDDFPYFEFDDNFMNSNFELDYGKFIMNEGYDDEYNDPIPPESYENLLNTLNWQMKRLEVILLRGMKCERCSSRSSLQVHHKIYIKKVVPWCYPRTDLIVLCKKCHTNIHETMDIPVVSKKDYMIQLTMREKERLEVHFEGLYKDIYKPNKINITLKKEENTFFQDLLFNAFFVAIFIFITIILANLFGKK